MYDTIINHPVLIVPGVAPVIKYDSLCTSTIPLTVGYDRVMNRDVLEDDLRWSKAIAGIMRAVFSRFGHVSIVDDNRELTGPISKQTLINKYDKPNTGFIASIRKMVNGNAYSKTSFIMRFVEGIISKESCFVKITNWDLHAKACRLNGDDVKAGEYEDAIADLQEKIQKACRQAYKDASEAVETSGPWKKVNEAKIQRDFLRPKLDDVVQPAFAGFQMNTAGRLWH